MEEMKLLRLDIQYFAEEDGDGQEPAKGEDAGDGKPATFQELLDGNKDYQKEFDRRISKGIDTAKAKWEEDFKKQLEAEKTEAEKLAKMNAEQKIQYELEQSRKQNEDLQSQLNAINLYKTASNIATEKELPVGYLDLIDFTKETAETITNKIDKISELRQKDLELYLNNKLKQKTPVEKETGVEKIDPYIEGFKAEF